MDHDTLRDDTPFPFVVQTAEAEVLTGDRLSGCDGGRSTVRKSIGTGGARADARLSAVARACARTSGSPGTTSVPCAACGSAPRPAPPSASGGYDGVVATRFRDLWTILRTALTTPGGTRPQKVRHDGG
ncbi:hypothetical protein [Actinomadura sp. 3N407]|uniref:hypothetical protein n=1 Tax=Actinomadura sp. 3N407 TaxID=3457423 RepID=UPI003FCECD86